MREVPVGCPGPTEVQIQTLFSGISAGTEMNVYRGRAPQWEMRHDPETRLFARAEAPEWRYPLAYGYANVGRVVEVGAEVTGLSEGDVVFSYSPHQSVVVADAAVTVAVPDGLDPRAAGTRVPSDEGHGIEPGLPHGPPC